MSGKTASKKRTEPAGTEVPLPAPVITLTWEYTGSYELAQEFLELEGKGMKVKAGDYYDYVPGRIYSFDGPGRLSWVRNETGSTRRMRTAQGTSSSSRPVLRRTRMA